MGISAQQQQQQLKSGLSNAPVQRRLFITGLAPTIKAQDLVDRFATFGAVVGGEKGVAGLGLDAVGAPRRFAVFTIESTEAQLNKCISMLSGSMWKGSKLRIAYARPDYKERLEAERKAAAEQAAKPPKKKKRKRTNDPDVGVPATHFEVVDADNIERHKGWSLDNTAPTPMPIFPLVTRPTYPLPPQPEKVVTAWTRDPSKKAKAKAKARDASGSSANGFVPENTLVRARRIRIDPRKWGRQKTVFDDASGGTLDGMRAAGTWECVDLDDESAVGEPKAVWVFKARDGTVRRRDVISLGQKHVPHTDRFTALLEGLNRPITAPLAVLAPTEADPILVDDISLAAESPRAAKRVKSLSPPPYVPTASRSLLYNEEDTFALMQATQAADELEAARKKERESQLALLGGLLADATPANETRHEIVKPRARVEGFADDSDDEDFLRSLARPKAAMNGGTLNLRGGAASESDEDDSGSDDSSDSDRDEDVVMTTAEDAVSSKVKISLAKGSLKDMFKPQEKQAEGSFSLLSGLDLELEPLERTPSPPPAPAPISFVAPATSSRLVPPSTHGGRQSQTSRPTGPITPFFAFPTGVYEDRDGQVDHELAKAAGLDEARIAVLKAESGKRLGDRAAGCWRTQTSEAIEEQHLKLRESLRGVARKRHREAAKRTRQKGGAQKRGAAGAEGV